MKHCGRIWFFYLWLAAACSSLTGCSPTILEYRDVQGFSVKEVVKGHATQLEIAGSAFHSALAVKEIAVRTAGKVMIVEVLLTPSRKGLSGRFEHRLDIPYTVEVVEFGREHYPIWKR